VQGFGAQSGLDELENALGYRFQNRPLLIRALTHSSSANEMWTPVLGQTPHAERMDNERLEFLGDSVLGWLVSEWLFARFRDFSEGQLSMVKNHLVSSAHLLAVAHRLDLGKYLQLGRGEETAGGRSKQRLLVNAFEAVLAAVYLDGGAEPVRRLLAAFLLPEDDEVMEIAGAGPPQDHRAELERLARDRGLPRPFYALAGESGPGHARRFLVEARVGDLRASGEGPSKKAASHAAAREICLILRAVPQ
jgi:ribonuclease III